MITHFIESLSKMNKKLALLLAFAFCGFSLILLTDPYKEILDSVDPTEEISSLPDEGNLFFVYHAKRREKSKLSAKAREITQSKS